jgi:hypothetical protein
VHTRPFPFSAFASAVAAAETVTGFGKIEPRREGLQQMPLTVDEGAFFRHARGAAVVRILRLRLDEARAEIGDGGWCGHKRKADG